MDSSRSPGSASSASRTGTETSPAIGRSTAHSRSRFSRIVPSSEDSTGTTPASSDPSRTPSNTARNEDAGSGAGGAKKRSTASSAKAPGSPVYPTRSWVTPRSVTAGARASPGPRRGAGASRRAPGAGGGAAPPRGALRVGCDEPVERLADARTDVPRLVRHERRDADRGVEDAVPELVRRRDRRLELQVRHPDVHEAGARQELAQLVVGPEVGRPGGEAGRRRWARLPH